MEYYRAFATMGITPDLYIKKYAIPLVGIGLLFPILITLILGDLTPPPVKTVLYLIPVALTLLIVMYPITFLESRKRQIDDSIHYYVTELGVLSTARMSRKDLMGKVSENEAYGFLAEETAKIHMLMDKWNLSFARACQFIAQRTPSWLFADFLGRFAHAVQAGEDVETFLRSEQKVVMNDFDTMYRDALHSIDMITELFVSLMMSLIFIVSFAIILPVIIGMDSTLLMLGSLLIFAVSEVALVYFAKLRVPKDRIWHTLDIETRADRAIKRTFPISIIACGVVGVVVFVAGIFPTNVMIAMMITPLIITGRVASREEEKIKRKDDNFAAFIRSLGATAGARGGMVNESLRELTEHDFGPLSEEIRALYKRLATRVNKVRSWEYFAAGTGSNLIERFGTIFAEGTHIGGKPEVIGEIIGDNFMHITSLRKLRYSSSRSLVGTLYGLTAGIAFTLFLSVVIMDMLTRVFTSAEIPAGMDIGLSLDVAESINMEMINLFVILMMLIHAALSSILIRIVDGGHIFNTYTHFVGLTWTSVICAEMTVRLVTPMISAGGGWG
ncbi:Type II secretion system (T2SS), protein F [Candidatus Methanoperedenaceae archaeon GB37]|nr:Type II secretion system (T2SS), protein F [Candidatus Methanoperedenaceae archaeon GB37]